MISVGIKRRLRLDKKDKMFNPEITKGEWIVDHSHPENNLAHIKIGCPQKDTSGGFYVYTKNTNEDASLIAASPELLEVYKQARKVIDNEMWEDTLEFTDKLEKAIKKLENMHCE